MFACGLRRSVRTQVMRRLPIAEALHPPPRTATAPAAAARAPHHAAEATPLAADTPVLQPLGVRQFTAMLPPRLDAAARNRVAALWCARPSIQQLVWTPSAIFPIRSP